MIEWREDVLGDGFECTDIDLGSDDEGPVVATLVRSLPERQILWHRMLGRRREFENLDILYVHGWSDYFFQKHVARFFTERGARFFALDLRKYGRSIREGQTHGFIDNLEDYDQEIEQALALMRSDEPTAERKLVLFGHSTGGLVLSLWANRNPGVADALVLNSPWLELQLTGAARAAVAAVVNVRARLSPHDVALPQLDRGFYSQAQKMTDSPELFAGVNEVWRPEHTVPVRGAWLKAIFAGHSAVAEGLDVGAPVCVLLSRKTHFGLTWQDDMGSSDTVLDVERVARAALRLGPSVTVERLEGAIHDVFLSRPEVRDAAFNRVHRWLRGWNSTSDLDDQPHGQRSNTV